MPLYEYECQQCHKRVEKIQKFSDAPLTTCLHCGGQLERTLTAPAIQFKGSGWYKDLYSSAKPSNTSSASEGSSSGSASEGGSASGGDKPAAPAAAPAASSPAPSSSSSSSSSSSGS